MDLGDQLIPILILMLAGYLCIYGIVNRICTCVETYIALKASGKARDAYLEKIK